MINASENENDSLPDSGIPAATDREYLTLWIDRQDTNSLELLIRRHGRLVHSLTQKLLTSPHDRADAFQTVFLLLTQQARKIRRRESLAMWIYGVTVRTCLMMSRQRAHLPVPEHLEAPTYPSREVLEHQDMILTLNKELHQLPEHLRESLVLVYLEGHSRQTAAELMNTTEQTIKSRLARGRNLLRARLLKQGVTFTTAFTTFSLMTPSSEAAVPLSEQLIDQTLMTCQTGELTGGSFTLPLDPITILPTGAPVMSSTTFYGTLAVTTLLLLTTMGLGNRGKAEGRIAAAVNVEVPESDVMEQETTPVHAAAALPTANPPANEKESSSQENSSSDGLSDPLITYFFEREVSLPLGPPTKDTKADVYAYPANLDPNNPQLISVMENVNALPVDDAGNKGLVVQQSQKQNDEINRNLTDPKKPFVVVPHGKIDIVALSRMVFQADEPELKTYRDLLDGYLGLIHQSSTMNAKSKIPEYSKEELYKDWKKSNDRARNLLEESLVHMETSHSDPALAKKIKEFRQSHYQLAREHLKKIRSNYLQRVLDSQTIEDDVLKQLDIIDDSLAEFDRSEARNPRAKEQPASDVAQPSDDVNVKAIQSAYQLQALEYIQNRFSLLQLQTTKEQPDEIKSIEQGLTSSLGRQEESLAKLEQQLAAYSEADAAKARRIREIAYDILVTKIEDSIRKRTEEEKYPDPRNRQIIEHLQKTMERISQEKTLGDFRTVAQSERSYLEPVSFERIPDDELSSLEEELPELKKRLHALRRDFGPDIQEARRLANYINFLESQKKIEKTYVKSPDGKRVLLHEPGQSDTEVNPLTFTEQQSRIDRLQAELAQVKQELAKQQTNAPTIGQGSGLRDQYHRLMSDYMESRFDLMLLQISKDQPAVIGDLEKSFWRTLDRLEEQLISLEAEAASTPEIAVEMNKDRILFYTDLIDRLNNRINFIDQTQMRQPLKQPDPHDEQIRDHILQTLRFVREESELGSFKAVSEKIRTDLSSILFKKLPPPKNLSPEDELAILSQKLAELQNVLGWDHPAVKRLERDLRESKKALEQKKQPQKDSSHTQHRAKQELER